MTYYLADFDIRDSDNEYDFQFLGRAEDLEDAEKKADEKWGELDLFSRIIRKGNLPQEVPDIEASILKKYFWVAPEFTERQGK